MVWLEWSVQGEQSHVQSLGAERCRGQHHCIVTFRLSPSCWLGCGLFTLLPASPFCSNSAVSSSPCACPPPLSAFLHHLLSSDCRILFVQHLVPMLLILLHHGVPASFFFLHVVQVLPGIALRLEGEAGFLVFSWNTRSRVVLQLFFWSCSV